MGFALSQTLSISDRVLSQQVSGETVLLDLASEQYFGLDPVGTRIWQLLKEERTPGEILDDLCREYDASREKLEGDMQAFLGQLADAGLIAPAGSNAAPE